ncbi:ABC transporter substrate-binding protein [Dactylosporangium cerinum]|uniref:ABC transporter substrate-binding protein n=1 Tax=Dactylosporangium cerinum TaxID=1434730 RepID=A0ABV9WHB7_9ACTN
MRASLLRPATAVCVAVIATGMLTSACGEGPAADASAAPIKIGLLATLHGTYAAVGTDIQRGFEVYLKSHGGKLGGHPVDLKVADEGDSAASAMPAALNLVNDEHIVAMTGIVGGGTVAAVAPMLREERIPLVSANGRPGMDTVDGFWSTSFRSSDPGTAIAPFIKSTVAGPVFVIGPDYQGGRDEIGGFVDNFAAAGGKIANPGGEPLWTPFPATTNFMPYFDQIKRTGAKAIYAFYAGKAAIDFVKQYRRSDARTIPLYGAFLTEGSVLKEEGDAAIGISTVANYSADLQNPENDRFVAAWRQAHPESPTPTTFAMASYDAAAVLDRAIAAAGPRLTPEAINEQIGRLGDIPSPRGTWRFDGSHGPIQKWYLRQVRAGEQGLTNALVQELATIGG